jgi:predicted AAA+ superfamily ATPase
MGYVKRDLEEEIKKHIKSREMIAVVGPRQSGKTTLINNLTKDLKNVNTVSFDDVKQLKLFEDDVDSFIELNVKGFDFLFIDEVQYAKDSGRKLKYIHDTQKTKVFISGSSSADLSIKSLKYLVGRIFIFKLLPFSFREFLRAKNERLLSLYETRKYGREILEQLNKHLQEFILYGGYPRVVLEKTKDGKKTILRNIYSTYLLREIKEITELSDNDKLINLMKSLSLQTGNIINYNELSNTTGFPYRELKRYMQILEETYITKRVTTFHTNKRTELVKSPKIYFYDTGFRNTCIDNYTTDRTDAGALHENLIFSELAKHDITPKYWRTKTGAEVDFILEKTPIEVKTKLNNTKTTRSLQSFIEKYHPKDAYILSLDHEDKKKTKQTQIKYLPTVKYLPTITNTQQNRSLRVCNGT